MTKKAVEVMEEIPVDDAPTEKVIIKKPEVEIATTDADDGVITELKSQLEALTKERDQEKSAREAAEAARVKAEKGRAEESDKAYGAWQGQVAAQESSIDNGIAAATSDLAAAEQEYERARESGDVKAEVAAQKKLARATIMADQWEVEKNRFLDWKKQEGEKIEEARKKPAPQQTSDRTREWIDNHPLFSSNEEYRESTMHFHKLAVKKGLLPDTKGYFDYIDSNLSRLFEEKKEDLKPKKEDPEIEEEEAPELEASSIAATPSRDGLAGNQPDKKTRIRLTRGEMDVVRNAAERDGITMEKAAQRYMRNKEKLIAEGHIQGNA